MARRHNCSPPQTRRRCAVRNIRTPSGQAQKEFFINQALAVVDALLQRGVSGSFAAPPTEAIEGQCFRVSANATGDWVGRSDDLAVHLGGAWHFVSPQEGMTIFDRGAGALLHFNAGWQVASEPTVPSSGTTIDTEVRIALSELIEALRNIGIFANNA